MARELVYDRAREQYEEEMYNLKLVQREQKIKEQYEKERRQEMEEGTVQAGPVQEEGPGLTSSPKTRQEIPKEKPRTPKTYFIQIQENPKLTLHR